MDENLSETEPLLRKESKSSISSRPTTLSRQLSPVNTSVNRDPFVVNTRVLKKQGDGDSLDTLAQYSRYKYYSKLHKSVDNFVIPDHVLPSFLFLPIIKPKGAKQSSLITIFAIWNTMMGTSLLSLPWAFAQSGFGLGIVIIILMGVICFYTCNLILKGAKSIDDKRYEALEFVDVSEHYLGNAGKLISIAFSLVALLGATTVYWVLLSNFLFNIGKFIHDHTSSVHIRNSRNASHHINASIYSTASSVLCLINTDQGKSDESLLTPSNTKGFFTYWQKQKTVPFYLIVMLFPLSSLKSPTFFTKFNALGTICVFYIITFVCVKSGLWGGHLHFQSHSVSHPKTEVLTISGCMKNFGLVFPSTVLAPSYWNMYSLDYAEDISPIIFCLLCCMNCYSCFDSSQFPALTGTLCLALFIHNCILSITRNQEKPENNTRDLGIAYFLTAGTYFLIAVVFYSCFPLAKICIEQVLLDNFPPGDVMTFAAQVCLLFQMITVFPLLMYIIRVQVFSLLFKSLFPGWLHVFILNASIIGVGICFAVFYPQVGHIIRFVGSFSALVYIFALPCLVHMIILKKKNQLTWTSQIFHSFLLFLGIVNVIAQFLIN